MTMSPEELHRMALQMRRVAELEKDPAKVRELHYLAGIYDEELREAEQTERRCGPCLVTLLPAL